VPFAIGYPFAGAQVACPHEGCDIRGTRLQIYLHRVCFSLIEPFVPYLNTVLSLTLISAFGHAQTNSVQPPVEKSNPDTRQRDDTAPLRIHRLESVTWDVATCELVWVVSTGIKIGSRYTPSERQTYRMDMDAAVMQVGLEKRAFDIEEAEGVHDLLDLISRYAAESSIWWENGEGDKPGKDDPVANNPPKRLVARSSKIKDVRVSQPKPASKH
jgi:hypothetical protein